MTSPQHSSAINSHISRGQQQRRPSSLHNSPGPSRPTSPRVADHAQQQQRRKSSHYPNGSAVTTTTSTSSSNNVVNRGQLGMPPPYGAATQAGHQHRLHQQQPQRGLQQQQSHVHQEQQRQHHQSNGSPVHRNSLSQMHFSNNAKRQLQQPNSTTSSVSTNQRQRQQQFSRTYSSDQKHTVGLPAPGFSSRLQMGTSQRSN